MNGTGLMSLDWCSCARCKRKDAFIAAGYDLQQVDFALPQNCVDDNIKGRGGFKPEDCVLDYSDASVFGKPLYVGGWMRRISRRVLEQLVIV